MASRFAFLVVLLAVALASADPLVGAAVGNSDSLVSEGSKLFNRKQYKKAADTFLKATRANPSNTASYLQLARSQLLAKQLTRACYAYRVYLKATSETPDRKKAAAESDQCERQLKNAKHEPPDPTQKYVETRAAFFAALDQNELLGPSGATEALRSLVTDGFLGPELGDMAQKLGAAAVAEADSIHKRAVALEPLPVETLRAARPLYQVASDVGTSPSDARSRMAYLDGLANLAAKDFKKAEADCGEAEHGDPANKEYSFCRALAAFLSGDRAGALKTLEANLKDDPRTAVLRVAQAVGHAPDSGAAELERLLFSTRFPPEK